MTTLSLTDAASPSVTRSFVQVQQSPDLAVFKDYTTNGGYPVGAATVSLSVKENSNGTMKVEGRLTLPQLEVVAGETTQGFVPAPQAAAISHGSFVFTFPSRTALQTRKDLKAMLIDLLQDAIITAAVENFVRP